MTYALVILWIAGAHVHVDTLDHGLTAADCEMLAEVVRPFIAEDVELTCEPERHA